MKQKTLRQARAKVLRRLERAGDMIVAAAREEWIIRVPAAVAIRFLGVAEGLLRNADRIERRGPRARLPRGPVRGAGVGVRRSRGGSAVR